MRSISSSVRRFPGAVAERRTLSRTALPPPDRAAGMPTERLPEPRRRGGRPRGGVRPGAGRGTGEEAAPFPADRSAEPLQRHLSDYGPVPLAEGIETTYQDFKRLLAAGALSPEAVSPA